MTARWEIHLKWSTQTPEIHDSRVEIQKIIYPKQTPTIHDTRVESTKKKHIYPKRLKYMTLGWKVQKNIYPKPLKSITLGWNKQKIIYSKRLKFMTRGWKCLKWYTPEPLQLFELCLIALTILRLVGVPAAAQKLTTERQLAPRPCRP